jgi:hypothetical protein
VIHVSSLPNFRQETAAHFYCSHGNIVLIKECEHLTESSKRISWSTILRSFPFPGNPL